MMLKRPREAPCFEGWKLNFLDNGTSDYSNLLDWTVSCLTFEVLQSADGFGFAQLNNFLIVGSRKV